MSRNLKEDIVCLIVLVIAMSALFYVAHISNNDLESRIMRIEERHIVGVESINI